MVRIRRLGGLTLVIACGACAPRDFMAGVPYQVRASGVGDAKTQGVRGLPFLRVDAWVLDQLDRVERTPEAPWARDEAVAAVEAAYRLAQDSVNNELDRLPDAAVEKVWTRHFGREGPPNDLRAAVRTEFWARGESAKVQLVREIEGATPAGLQHAARTIRLSALRSPKDHHGSGIVLALVSESIKDTTGSLDRGGLTADVYRPEENGAARVAGDPQEDDLLRRFAPIIVQERHLDAPYPGDADRIGTIRLQSAAGLETVVVDTSAPSVYGYVTHTRINDQPRTQLTYVHWFPEHPAKGVNKDDCGCGGAVKTKRDLEAGRIDGGTLRITLDRAMHPILFETILNCGCYHRCFPAQTVEDAACAAYGGPLAGKHYCVEQDVPDKKDWITPEAVDVSLGEASRPILFSRAGYHGLVAVVFDEGTLDSRRVLETRRYALRPYGELERLPLESGYGSMFQADGLVCGAEREEGRLMAITGMLSAGQPRQRGTQRIHWDDYDFDDPHLLEKCLRLPPGL